MKKLAIAAVVAMAANAASAAPAPKDAITTTKETIRDFNLPALTEQAKPATFKVPTTEAPGAWVRLCVTELRYIAFTDQYMHSGFARTPGGETFYFGVTKSGIIMSPASHPVLVPISEGFTAPATPDLWSFLRDAADDGKWVEFYAWAPNDKGVQRVTQVRRNYPSGEAAPCPAL